MVELEEGFLLLVLVLRFLLLLLRLLAPVVTGFSLVLGASSSSVSELEGFKGGFASEGGFSFLSLAMVWVSLFWPEVAGEALAEIELRLRQTKIGAEAWCLERRESGLAGGAFGGSESLFWGEGSDCD